jgi:pre-mRNA-splicing factor RBM22/SLT11
MPITGDMANQNIQDRYYGKNDPVAMKMLARQVRSGCGRNVSEVG